MDIKQQQAIADTILDKLYVIDPHCILAGGAPRDWYFGLPATDLDFYVYLADPCGIRHLYTKLYGLGLVSKEILETITLADYDYSNSDQIKWIISFMYEGQKVQIMIMYKPTFKSVLPHFSLSICHIWYKNKRIRTEGVFDRTVEEKVIRQTQEAFGQGYISKILAKFPDYEFVPLAYDYDKPIPF
jgi:hypothetical protein